MSILIFAIGGGFAIFDGIDSLKDPKIVLDPGWNYAVLGTAVLFEYKEYLRPLSTFCCNRKIKI